MKVDHNWAFIATLCGVAHRFLPGKDHNRVPQKRWCGLGHYRAWCQRDFVCFKNDLLTMSNHEMQRNWNLCINSTDNIYFYCIASNNLAKSINKKFCRCAIQAIQTGIEKNYIIIVSACDLTSIISQKQTNFSFPPEHQSAVFYFKGFNDHFLSLSHRKQNKKRSKQRITLHKRTIREGNKNDLFRMAIT